MSIRFDAAADRLTYAGSIPVPTSGLTITAWVKIVVDQNANSTFFRVYNSGLSTVITCATDVDGTAGNNYFTGGGSPANGQQMGTGTWRAIAIAHDTGTTGRAYVRIGSTTTVNSGAVSSSTPAGICIGGRDSSDATEWFNGEIAQVRIWSSELTQAQIEAEWASSTPVITSGLYANWPLATATALTDTVASRVLTTPNGTGQTTGTDDPPNGATGTTATSAAATGTGTANNPKALVTTPVALAAGTGAANSPTARVTTPVALASGTGAALSPTANVRAFPPAASGTGAALSPTVLLVAPLALATGTGQAFNPTASAPGSTTATPPTATGAGQANNPTAQVVTPVALATGTGAALAPAVRVAALPPTAVGTGQALSPAVRLTAPLTPATGTGAAFNPTALTVPITTATPATATGTGQAFNPIIRLVVIPATAVGTGTAFNPVGAGLSPAFPLRTGTIVDNVARLRTGTIVDNVPRYRARP